MGLDLFCTGLESIKMGSYSTVQEVRLHWIFAYIQYLQNTNPSSTIIKELNQCVQNNDINYEKFFKLRNQGDIGFSGLYDFVYHSDCEGIWEPEEVKEIMITLGLIRKFLRPITFSWHFYNENEYYLENMFKHSIENDKNIRFS
jgi:hypothetical protein